MEKLQMEDVDGGFVLVGFQEPEESHEEDNHFTSYGESAYCDDIILAPRKRFAFATNTGAKPEGMKQVIKQQVLTFLPAKSVYRFRAVSKDWDGWISSPLFAHQQSLCFNTISGLFSQLPGEPSSFISLDRDACGVPIPSLSFLPEPAEIRATNGGLLCCRSHVGSYYICNPVTKLWTKLPEPSMYHGPGTVVGLTFEPSKFNFTEHYQLVCAVVSSSLNDYSPSIVSFEVFSSRSSEWRLCECYYLGGFLGDGLYLDGFVYWETREGNVMAFDVKNENFGFLTLPPNSGPDGTLSVMNGEVCYLLPVVNEDLEWMVEVYGNLDMGLKRVIRLAGSAYKMSWKCRVLAFANDKLLIAVFGMNIVAYDAEADKEEWIGKASLDGFGKYVPYVNNLVNIPAAQVEPPPAAAMDRMNWYDW
ncbi:F-box protein At5g49610 [Linum grandiflorum]